MKRSAIKNILELLISYSYIVLFTYAATSKLLDYENFLLQVGQSPLLTAFAEPVTIMVPVTELIIVVLLCFTKSRVTGLFASFSLMLMFTTYIFLILNYSSFVPCSCGGILEKLGWTEHLIFNFIFVLLALCGILLSKEQSSNWLRRMKPLYFTILIIATALLSFTVVLVLFLFSEKMVHERNSFIRRFPAHILHEEKKLNLKVNSYYFSGSTEENIYLGNYTAPLTVMIIDSAFKNPQLVRLKLDTVLSTYRSLHLRVLGDNFYVSDGTVPCIYIGSIKNWEGALQKGRLNNFTLAEPIDEFNIAFRQLSTVTNSNLLGAYNLKDSIVKKVNRDLLVKQESGLFDTDGMLMFNQQLKQLNYVYYYRNEFLSIGLDLNLIQPGRTIDTVTKAKISVKKLENGESAFDAPPLIINKNTSVFKNLLFIESERIGKYDRPEKLKNASVIDVYDLHTGNYVASFYLYNINSQKMKSFRVQGNKIYYLSGNYLSVLELSKKITRHYNNASTKK